MKHTRTDIRDCRYTDFKWVDVAMVTYGLFSVMSLMCVHRAEFISHAGFRHLLGIQYTRVWLCVYASIRQQHLFSPSWIFRAELSL